MLNYFHDKIINLEIEMAMDMFIVIAFLNPVSIKYIITIFYSVATSYYHSMEYI